jgi:hypothetical protein
MSSGGMMDISLSHNRGYRKSDSADQLSQIRVASEGELPDSW